MLKNQSLPHCGVCSDAGGGEEGIGKVSKYSDMASTCVSALQRTDMG